MPNFRSVKQEVQETLDSRTRLATWLESDKGDEWLGNIQHYVGDRLGAAPMARSIVGAATVLKATIRRTTSYFVEEEMLDVAEAAAAHASFPGYNFSKDEMPSPYGFVYLARPVVVAATLHTNDQADKLLVEEVDIPIHGFYWDATSAANDRFVSWTFTSSADLVDYSPGSTIRGLLEGYPSLFPTGHVVLKYGATGWSGTSHQPDEEMRVLKTLWLLMSQRLTETKTVRGPRHEIEKAQRKGRPIPEVTVVMLRRMQATPEYEGEHGHREYSHRFIVGGHWRTYRDERYSEKVRSVPKWISPYVKGDPHKPLVVKDKVYRLAR